MLRADTIIWLDYPRRVCMTRVIGRVQRDYGRVRADMTPGCPERFDLKFLTYVWTFPKLARPRIVASLERFAPHAQLHHLRSDADAARFSVSIGGGR